MKKIKIKAFGAFKKYVADGVIEVLIDNDSKVKDVKTKINECLIAMNPNFSDTALVFESALATDNEILQDESLLSAADHYAILPPVCGG